MRILLALLPMALLIGYAPGKACADSGHKPRPITLVLYLESQGPAGAPADTQLSMRDRLRSNERLEVLVFDPSAPTFILAAKSTTPPISLDSVTTAQTRLSLAQAAGAQFVVMAAPTDVGSDHMDIRLFELYPTSRSWSFDDKGEKDAARAVESQVLAAAAEPAPAAPSAPISPPAASNPPAHQAAPIAPAVVLPAQPVPSAPAPAPQAAPSTTPALPPALPIVQAPAPTAAPPPTPEPSQQTIPAPVEAAPIALPPAPAPPSSEVPAPTAPAQSPAQTPVQPPQTEETLPQPPAQPRHHGRHRPAPAAPMAAPLVSPPPTASEPAAPSSPVTLDDVAQGKIADGDLALQQSDLYGAISFYREAVNISPRSMVPRIRLIRAYLQAGLSDQAQDEARRALMLDPNDAQVQSLLAQSGGSLPDAALMEAQAAVERDPTNETAWIALGDADWNTGQIDQALAAYQKAAQIKPDDIAPEAHLARLYAATSQYGKSLDALAKAGEQGYPFALLIIASRAESLIADLDTSKESYDKGETTREQYYDALKKDDAQSQALAQFVAKIAPPSDFKVSYLHRRLATNLLAQATADWISFTETNDSQYSQQAALLQSEAVHEMKTASIAERLQSSVSAAH